MCKGRKVDVFNGIGSLGADHTVTVAARRRPRRRSGRQRAARRRLGAAPIPGFERGGPIMTSDEVLDLDYVPARVAVIGGGAIGCEFASTFADLGAKVTILEFLPKILPGLDADVANVVVRSFKKKKIDIRTGVKVNGPHARTGRAARRCTSATGEIGRGRRRDRVGRAPAVRRPARARTAPASRSPTAASSRSTSAAAPANRASTRSAT